MRIDILHHDLEPAEECIAELLRKQDIDARLIDIRQAELDSFTGTNLVLNRVYASVANRDYASISRTLNLLRLLEEKGIKCLNSYRTSLFDYSKMDSYLEMSRRGIYTPRTLFFSINEEEIQEQVERITSSLDFPIVLKRNTGGRGKDISKLENLEELIRNIASKIQNAEKERYFGGFVAQEFIESSREYDCRIGIINQKFAFSYKRSLIPKKQGEKPWIASISNGSIEGDYDAKKEEINLALKASTSIGAEFNELDVMFASRGPCIIENNPTPNYIVTSQRDQELMKLFIKSIISRLKNEKGF